MCRLIINQRNQTRLSPHNMELTMNDDRDIQKARAHMTAVALGLATKLGPLDAAGVLIGAATGVLTATFGHEKAAEYFREIAAGIENGEGGSAPVSGHA
jgi:hypothetical protein